MRCVDTRRSNRRNPGGAPGAIVLLGIVALAGCVTPGLKPPQGVPAGTGTAVPADRDAGVAPEVRSAYARALGALKAGRTEDAQRALNALVKANPELAGPHANLGMIHRRAGRMAESAAELEKAVSLNPKQPAYQNQLGITYRHQGQFKKARDAYREAIALDPNFAAAHLNLGILYDIYLWDGSRALEHYRQYLSLAPGGDDKVNKWVADLNNRSQKRSGLDRREEEG
jgi:tetratricopeptide (TPR) repeat protein